MAAITESGAAPAAAFTGPQTAGVGAAAFVGGRIGDPIAQNIGERIGVGGEKERGFVGKVGGATAAGAAVGSMVLPGPGTAAGAIIGAVVGTVDWATSGGTWICTAIDTLLGLSPETKRALYDLRRYSVQHHKEEARKYFKNGFMLVQKINEMAPEMVRTYTYLKTHLVAKCVELVQQGDLEAAYQRYRTITEELCAQYGVDLSIKENES